SKISDDYSLIDRSDSIQIETSGRTGETVRAKITWTSPCEYELLYQSQIKTASNTINKFLQSQPVKVKIIKSGDGFYIFESRTEGVNLVYTDTMRVVAK